MSTTAYSKRGMSRYQRMRRIVLFALTVLLFGVLVFGQGTLPEEAHEHLEDLGLALMFAGVCGRLWSILYIGGRKSSEIVEAGPYSVTRNPLYLFSTVAATGVGAQMGSIAAALGFGLLCALAFQVVIRYEEAHLRANFGRAFEDYCRRVPRFFPNVRLYREPDFVTFRPRVLRTTLLDGLVFLAAIPFFETIEQLQDAGLIPVLFRLW